MKESLREHKRWRRKEIAEIRKELSDEYIADASAEVKEKLLVTEEYRNANTIMCYLDFGKEVKTGDMIDTMWRDGKKVCIPLCTDTEGHIMVAKLYTEDTALVKGAYGIMEPSNEEPTIAASEIDLIILPCVSCDRSCNRLGHGAGYYDRYLAKTDAKLMALCAEKLMSDEIPMDEFDVPLDAVITEIDIYRRG